MTQLRRSRPDRGGVNYSPPLPEARSGYHHPASGHSCGELCIPGIHRLQTFSSGPGHARCFKSEGFPHSSRGRVLIGSDSICVLSATPSPHCFSVWTSAVLRSTFHQSFVPTMPCAFRLPVVQVSPAVEMPWLIAKPRSMASFIASSAVLFRGCKFWLYPSLLCISFHVACTRRRVDLRQFVHLVRAGVKTSSRPGWR